MSRKTVLIFGISSFVGSNLAEFLKKYYRIVGTYYSTIISMPDILTVQCDALNRDSVQMILYCFKPEITIYCGGLTSLEDCIRHDKLADALNTAAVFNITTFTERYKSKFCYISSAYIFPGLNKLYNENDPPDPGNIYGKTKTSAEFYIQKSCLNYLIFRCCILYGRSINPRQFTVFEMIQKKILNDESFSMDHTIYNGFIDVWYLAYLFRLSIERDVTNRLFQLTSKNVMTYYEFAEAYCKVFSSSSGQLRKGQWKFPDNIGELSSEQIASLKGKRYFKINLKNLENFFRVELPTIEESLQLTHARMGGGGLNKHKAEKASSIQFI